MSEDPQESLDLFDDHEEVVSEDGKKVTRKGSIYFLISLQLHHFFQASSQ